MDKKLQRKELFKLWIQRKGDHSNIKTEYIQNSVIGIHRYLYLRIYVPLVDFVYNN